MRLLEGEVRAASISFSAPGARFTTHASNFSWRKRSAEPAEVTTVSIPNWRKHSVSKNRDDSFKSTKAARAAFLPVGVGARAVPKAFCMMRDRLGTKLDCGLSHRRCKEP